METTKSRILSLLLIATVVFGLIGFTQPVQAAPTELFFSEYIEGTSNNKALEIYNGTGAAVDLAAGGYNIQMFFNGSATSTLTITLTGTVAAGDVYVVAHSSAVADILAQADQTNGAGWFNGDDAVALFKDTATVDVIGQIGYDPGSEWGTGDVSTQDNTLRRKSTICAGDPNGADVFDPALEWDGFPVNTFDGLGAHTATCGSPGPDTAPEVIASFPVDGATDMPINATLSVTFSEPVNVSAPWFTLNCTVSGAIAATYSGGPTAFDIDPTSDFIAGESCTLTVLAARVTDQDADDPPDNMAADFVVNFTTADVCATIFIPAYSIQGAGLDAAITGAVTTQGVVVGDYEGPSPALRGFFLQDLTGDGNPATSDGLFVFNGNNNSVNLGDVVRVAGTAADFQGQTQVSASTITACGTGAVSPVDVTLPFPTADYPEQYEGMLVRLPQTLTVTEIYQLGRFDEVLLSSGGRLYQPTNLYPPGLAADALQAANNLNQILIDDGTNAQNPDPIVFARGGLPLSASNTLRGGDTATGIVGVLNYTWGGASASPNAYRVRPVQALGGYVNFEPVNLRPTTAPAPTGGLRVVGMNLLNYFNTFDGLPDTVDNCTLGVTGGPTDCRGADGLFEFDRQWHKTVAAIPRTGGAVVGIIEIENDGYGPASAIQELTNQLNAATAPGTYAFIDVDAATGQLDALGNDAIKVGLLYKPALVAPVGQTAALNSLAFVNGGDGDPRNRPTLAQAFVELSTGGRFVVAVNHLKSKGSACDAPDIGDGQANCNIVRLNAANLLTAWLAADPTGIGDPDALIVGDLNSYAKEDPITAIEGAGYSNLIESYLGADAYSYVFDGQWGYLDHALGSTSLTAQVTGVAEWHIDADEPTVLDYNTNFKTAGQIVSLYAPDEFRISDHDPVLVDLDLINALPELGDILVAPNPVAVGVTVNASAPFTDPDQLDTHTAVWDWGDGATSAGAITETDGVGLITGSHAYAAAGLYTVTVTVSDNFGHSTTATYQYVVVYDPNGGYTNGGGGIMSPAGAYSPNPALAGKLTFSFYAKYRKGGTTPEGQLRFYFRPADLRFESTRYDWLVVDLPNKTAQLQGAGTLNGAGLYNFTLWVTDDPDTFRIRVWDPSAPSDPPIYDNGAPLPVEGGNIWVR